MVIYGSHLKSYSNEELKDIELTEKNLIHLSYSNAKYTLRYKYKADAKRENNIYIIYLIIGFIIFATFLYSTFIRPSRYDKEIINSLIDCHYYDCDYEYKENLIHEYNKNEYWHELEDMTFGY